MKANLFTKMLILLAVPLVLQLCAILWYDKIFSDISEQIRYQNACMYAVRKVAVLATIMVDMSQSIGEIEFKHSRYSQSETLTRMSELNNALEDLRGVGEPYPDIVECTTSLAKETKQRMNGWFDKAIDGEKVGVETIGEFREMGKVWSRKSQWLMDRPAMYIVENYKEGQIRNAVLVSTGIVVFANLIAAILLATIIRLNIVRQVRRQQDNFQRLATNKPLLAPVEGSDEIALFDRAFHGIVEEVVAARKERQDYLAIMNSSMRKPLLELEEFIEKTRLNEASNFSEKGKTALTSSANSIKRLVAMLNELIDFDQIEQGSLALVWRETTAHEVVDNAIACVQYRAKHSNVQIGKEVAELAFDADPDRLVQVLINLLTNAIKFSPADSVVTVRVSRGATGILFSVEDQGRGVPADKLGKIFMRFEQVDKSDSTEKKGSGLGLAICKTIVEAHGGKIWAENNADVGATFSFSIPRKHN